MLLLAGLHALLSAVGGLYLHVWFNTDMAAAVVVCGGVFLLLAWLLGPVDGLMWKWFKEEQQEPSEESVHSACSE